GAVLGGLGDAGREPGLYPLAVPGAAFHPGTVFGNMHPQGRKVVNLPPFVIRCRHPRKTVAATVARCRDMPFDRIGNGAETQCTPLVARLLPAGLAKAPRMLRRVDIARWRFAAVL